MVVTIMSWLILVFNRCASASIWDRRFAVSSRRVSIALAVNSVLASNFKTRDSRLSSDSPSRLTVKSPTPLIDFSISRNLSCADVSFSSIFAGEIESAGTPIKTSHSQAGRISPIESIDFCSNRSAV